MTATQYFDEHGISEDSIKKFRITFDDQRIIIPIKDSEGNVLYNKYRNLDFNKEKEGAPKYQFDKGSEASLFNVSVLKDNNYVFLTEGEIDCVRLDQEGIAAATNTSGAGTFKDEWLKLFEGKRVYIVYDNDSAGKEGSKRVAQLLASVASKVYQVYLPEGYKDVCEYFLDHEKKDFRELVRQANEFIKEYNNDEDNLSILSWKDFKRKEFEAPKWVVEDFIPEKGLVAIAGAPESCKSFFATFLAIQIASGKSLFDLYEVTKTPVLLIDQENIGSFVQKRISRFIEDEEIPLFIFDKDSLQLNIENTSHFKKLLEFVIENKIGLVIIDTLRLIHDHEENSSTEMKQVFDEFKKLTRVTSVLLIHHHRKSDKFSRGKVNGEDMMGSIFIRGCVDYQFTLTKIINEEESTMIRVTQTKSRYTKPIKTFEVSLEEAEGKLLFKYQGEAQEEKSKKEEVKEQTLFLLGEQTLEKKDFIEQIVNEGMCGKRTLETCLKELEDEGKIGHRGSKKYVYFLISPQIASPIGDYEVAKVESENDLTQDIFDG